MLHLYRLHVYIAILNILMSILYSLETIGTAITVRKEQNFFIRETTLNFVKELNLPILG